MNDSSQKKNYCSKCFKETNHIILFSEEVEWSEEESGISYIHGSDKYEMVKCLGCDFVSLIHAEWMNFEDDPRTGEHYIHFYYYPPRSLRNQPRWLSSLTNKNITRRLLNEIYISLRNKCYSVAELGIRAVLEHIMIDKVGDSGSFKKNLENMANKGYVSESQKNALAKVLEIGHATMHRAFAPNSEDLIHTLDITESIIESIYINEKRIKNVDWKIPAREKRK